ALVRYAFYAAGAFALIAIVIIPYLRSDPVKRVDDKPAFRLGSPDLARLPMSTQVITGKRARIETRQYGRLYDRAKYLTSLHRMLMVMPAQGDHAPPERRSALRALVPLMSAGAAFSNPFYDLQTGFGPARAQEFRVDADGPGKLCLAYLSHVETPAVYLKGWY